MVIGLLHRTTWKGAPRNSFEKRAGAFKKYSAGDLLSHLSITVLRGVTLTNRVNSTRTIYLSSQEKNLKTCLGKQPSVLFFDPLSTEYTL